MLKNGLLLASCSRLRSQQDEPRMRGSLYFLLMSRYWKLIHQPINHCYWRWWWGIRWGERRTAWNRRQSGGTADQRRRETFQWRWRGATGCVQTSVRPVWSRSRADRRRERSTRDVTSWDWNGEDLATRTASECHSERHTPASRTDRQLCLNTRKETTALCYCWWCSWDKNKAAKVSPRV